MNHSTNIRPKDIQHYLNRYLPMDIAITEVEEVPDRFHAQLNAVSKTYVYRMTIMDVPSVFERKHTYHCFKTPDKKAMQQAALLFIGEHDFRNFSTAKKSKNTTRESTTLTFMEIMRKCRSSFRQTIFCTTWQDL